MTMTHLRNLMTLAAGAVALLTSLGTLAQTLPPARVYAKVAPSVWRVNTYDGDGLPLGQGSGVVIGPEMVVTNCHVLK